MMRAAGLRVLRRAGEACKRTLLNAKKPVKPRHFPQNQIVRSVFHLNKTLPRRVKFVSNPLSVLFRDQSYSSFYRRIPLANGTGLTAFMYLAFGFVPIAFKENGKSSPSPQTTNHLAYLEDLSPSFKEHKQEEDEVVQGFENDTANGGKPLVAKDNVAIITFTTTSQRRSLDVKDAFPICSVEECKNKEPKPSERQEKENLSDHSEDTRSEDASIYAGNFAKWRVDMELQLDLKTCEILAFIFEFPPSDCEALERSCAGRELLDVLIKRNIINEYDVTNLQKGLSILHGDKLNQEFVKPYQTSVEDDQYKLHKVKEVITVENVDKIIKDGKIYAAMGQRNNNHLKRCARMRGTNALQSNVVEDDTGNRSPSSVCGQPVFSSPCKNHEPSNVLGKTKDAQRPSKAGVKALLKSVGKSLKSFQRDSKRTVKSDSGSFKSRLKSRANSFKALFN